MNILVIVVKLSIFHLDKSLLKFVALLNILCEVVTEETSHELMSISNEELPSNILDISSQEETSHPDILSLKVSLSLNRYDISLCSRLDMPQDETFSVDIKLSIRRLTQNSKIVQMRQLCSPSSALT